MIFWLSHTAYGSDVLVSIVVCAYLLYQTCKLPPCANFATWGLSLSDVKEPVGLHMCIKKGEISKLIESRRLR